VQLFLLNPSQEDFVIITCSSGLILPGSFYCWFVGNKCQSPAIYRFLLNVVHLCELSSTLMNYVRLYNQYQVSMCCWLCSVLQVSCPRWGRGIRIESWFLHYTGTTTSQHLLTWGWASMWGGVVKLLYLCCTNIIFLLFDNTILKPALGVFSIPWLETAVKAGKLASLYISIPSTCWPWPTSPCDLVSWDMFFFLLWNCCCS